MFAGAEPIDDGARRSTRGWRSASGSPSGRASSTGSSTSRRSSRAAASTCRSETRPGCGRDSDVDALLAEGDRGGSWRCKPTQAEMAQRRDADARARRACASSSLTARPTSRSIASSLGSAAAVPASRRAAAGPVPLLHGADVASPVAAWRRRRLSTPRRTSRTRRPGASRGSVLSRLRRHWQFINELQLFEIHDHVSLRRPRLRRTSSDAAISAWRPRSITQTPWCARSRMTARGQSRV